MGNKAEASGIDKDVIFSSVCYGTSWKAGKQTVLETQSNIYIWWHEETSRRGHVSAHSLEEPVIHNMQGLSLIALQKTQMWSV